MGARIQAAGAALLRMPLFYKLLLANSAIVALGAVAGTIITVWHVQSFPGASHYDLIAFFATAGLGISFVVNYLVLRLALTPLDRLQAGVDEVQAGKLDVRVSAGLLSDERFDRLTITFNEMLARLEQDARQLHHLSGAILQAHEEERQRLARELHDETAQALTSLLVQLSVIERSAPPLPQHAQIRELRQLTAGTLEEVRRVALELRPTILDDLGLEVALASRVDELKAGYAIEAELAVRGLVGRLPRNLELVFYRVAQEALTNIARHAHARHAWVHLTREAGLLTLEVRDDGAGFDPTEAGGCPAAGLGLLGMRERLALVGGELRIESRAGQGTRVLARAPLHDPGMERAVLAPAPPAREPLADGAAFAQDPLAAGR